ncbi:DUF397 domain-containing protein [Amycolatopsis antarctica]|uniref:DUF397 domain-containing protein n=1 Tax=Amycolatopsis antarctica TaxID=1854586 RepID=A0A263DCF3_9PSEU|nr:DUF397 domain-containing protein [Amycolatopsis antarctica]OZM75187.1 DUF397 domain-containing protein [Amycolatopsis antarctica]
MQPELSDLVWRKSSFSGGNGQCVEVADAPEGGRYLRDTKDRSRAAHFFTDAEWRAFVRGVKAGEFD